MCVIGCARVMKARCQQFDDDYLKKRQKPKLTSGEKGITITDLSGQRSHHKRTDRVLRCMASDACRARDSRIDGGSSKAPLMKSLLRIA